MHRTALCVKVKVHCFFIEWRPAGSGGMGQNSTPNSFENDVFRGSFVSKEPQLPPPSNPPLIFTLPRCSFRFSYCG